MVWKSKPFAHYKRPVTNSEDFKRIDTLPQKSSVEHLYDDLRARVTKPGTKYRLWDRQCQALIEAEKANGLFAPIPVGGGKTLICLLLPTILDKRSVIFTTPSLVKQMEMDREKFKDVFHIRSDIQIIPYSTLSQKGSKDLLTVAAPDLIIADECHAIKAMSSARTKRFAKFMKKNPQVLFCGLSGTITKSSIKDFDHLLKCALKENAPIPYHWPTLTEWAECLDVGWIRRRGGVLMSWCEEGEDVREGFCRKMNSVTGVVSGEEVQVDSKLIIKGVMKLPQTPIKTDFIDLSVPPKVIVDAMKKVSETWTTPGGEEEFMGSLDLARVQRQVRLGGYYRLKWSKSVPSFDRKLWLMCKKEFNREVNKVLQYSAQFESPGEVEDNCRQNPGYLPGYSPWKRVKDRVKAPKNEWVWLDKWVVSFVKEYLREHGVSIIWTDTIEVGMEIASQNNLSYHGAGDATILYSTGEKSIVCSIKAHGEGKNLQHFSRALVVGGLTTGTTWEQLLGRLHRPGQVAKEVVYDVLFSDVLEQAQHNAEYIQQITSIQKLLRAKE